MPEYINKIRTASGDLPINYEALANLPTISNPNLLINSDFRRTVNQRGSAVYEGHDKRVYTIDRWCLSATDYGRTLEVLGDCVRYSNPNTTYQGFWFQEFERVLPTDYYTITVNVKKVTGNNVWVGNLVDDSAGNPIWGNPTTFNLKQGINVFTFYGECAGLYFQASISSSAELYWVKLEGGKTSTQFIPRMYGEEQELCRRYFDIICGTRVIGAERDMARNLFRFSIPRTKMMRDIPTITTRGNVVTNSTEGICVRNAECGVLGGFTFEYSARSWEVLVTAYSSTTLDRDSYATQLYLDDKFLICLDAEIY